MDNEEKKIKKKWKTVTSGRASGIVNHYRPILFKWNSCSSSVQRLLPPPTVISFSVRTMYPGDFVLLGIPLLTKVLGTYLVFRVGRLNLRLNWSHLYSLRRRGPNYTWDTTNEIAWPFNGSRRKITYEEVRLFRVRLFLNLLFNI